MRHITVIAAVLVLVASAASAQEVMTNADVVKLVRAGLTMSTIEAKIYASNVAFDIGTDALIELSRDVPDPVVRAMIVRQSEMRSGSAPRPVARPEPKNLTRRFDVAVHKNGSKYAKCDGGEIRVDASGVATSKCRGSNFDLRWSEIQGICFDYGYRGVIVFRTNSRDQRISTANRNEAREILDTIAAIRPDLSLRETCD